MIRTQSESPPEPTEPNSVNKQNNSTAYPKFASEQPRTIDHDIDRCYSDHPIFSLELWKERQEPGHEFVLIRTADTHRYYRIERRPSDAADFRSMLVGCKANDTITPLDDRDYERVCKLMDRKIILVFTGKPNPGLHTVLAYCNVIRAERDSRRYTLAQYNCYFFARTIILLITRYSFLCQYCVHISLRNDFGSLPGPENDVIMDQAVGKVPNSLRVITFLIKE